MAAGEPRAKRHSDYVQIVALRTVGPEHGDPSLMTFAQEELQSHFEAEPDGYVRISKEQAQELVAVTEEYVRRYGPLEENDGDLLAELRTLLGDWE